jgi:hypothetical protein
MDKLSLAARLTLELVLSTLAAVTVLLVITAAAGFSL